MIDSGLAAGVDHAAPDVDFHRWLADRHRHRAVRLGWSLAILLLVSAGAISFLVMQLNEATERYEAARSEIQVLNQRVERVESDYRAADRRAKQTVQCLENRLLEVSKGLRRLLANNISPAGYLRRYGGPPRCR